MKINLVRNVLRIGAVAGVIGTAYFSAKNGTEICRRFGIIKYEHAANGKPNIIKHYIKETPYLIKPLLPTIGCAAGSIVCMAASERISYRQIAALTASCVYLTKNRDFLERKLQDVVGKERLEEIKQEFTRKEASKIDFPSVEVTANGDLLCLEGYSGRWFRSSREAVEEAQEMLNKMHEDGDYLCLNDYYALLGISMTQFGHEFGWPCSEDWCDPTLRFCNTYLEPGEWDDVGPDVHEKLHEPILIMEIESMPMECWQEV